MIHEFVSTCGTFSFSKNRRDSTDMHQKEEKLSEKEKQLLEKELEVRISATICHCHGVNILYTYASHQCLHVKTNVPQGNKQVVLYYIYIS